MVDVSIVIVNWNGGSELLRTLEAVRAAAVDRPCEIVLVDNASTDGSADAVPRRFGDVRVIRNPVNIGFGAANNVAFSIARGRYVLLLNPDALIDRPALDHLMAFMDTHPQVGACGPRITEADGRSLSLWCARRDPHPLDVLFEYAYLYRLLPRHRPFARHVMGDWNHGDDRPVDALSGACMLVRREAIDQVGGFDEQFFMYGEDIDWCRRMRQAGWLVWFVAAASVHHAGARSTQQVGDHGARWAVESHLRYFRKWGTPLDVLKVRLTLSLGCTLRSLAWLVALPFRPCERRYALRRSAGYLRYSFLAWTT